MNVIIYSTTSCPYCEQLKSYLTQKNISFIEKLIDQDDNAKKELETLSGGFLGVPFSVIINNDGTKETILGFDKGKFDRIIAI